MSTTATIAAAFALVVHVFIFVMESVAWGSRWVNAVFRVRPADAETQKLFAFNQGIYNLALAVMNGTGLWLAGTGRPQLGVPLVLAGCGSMLLAALALLFSARHLWRASLIQGAAPALALAALLPRLLG